MCPSLCNFEKGRQGEGVRGLLHGCHVLEQGAEILDGDSVLDRRAHSLQTKAQEVGKITEGV